VQIQGVTISVANLEEAKLFYEQVPGFHPDSYYQPTRWQSYKLDGRAYLGIIEVSDISRSNSKDIVNFNVDDVEAYWKKVKGSVEVEADLSETPWGSKRFIIKDPDGNRLGFAQAGGK
jgi:predicted enzyme related to lactoylglutathione lyase